MKNEREMREIKLKRGSLKYQFHQILKGQHDFGKGRSRHADKKEHGGHALIDRIYSDNSYKKHLSHAMQFHDYLKANSVNKVHQIEQSDVEEYLEYRKNEGLSHRTLAADATAINHLLAGNNNKEHDLYRLSELDIEGNRERKNNRLDRALNTIPAKYDEQIDFVRSTGLRRQELANVGSKSLYRVEDSVYVVTRGKGGRIRYAEVNESSKAEFEAKYGHFIIEKGHVSELPATKEEVQKVWREQDKLFEDKLPSKYPIHIFRVKYAKVRFDELVENGNYRKYDEEVEVNGFKADKGVFVDLTKNLGHNRIDVLKSYLRNK